MLRLFQDGKPGDHECNTRQESGSRTQGLGDSNQAL